MGGPFLAGVMSVGPRMDAWINADGGRFLDDDDDKERGRWVPVPGV